MGASKNQNDEANVTRIKSFEMNNGYEAIYRGASGDPPGSFGRIRIHGFALVTDGDVDSVEPFLIGDDGFEVCNEAQNYIGIVPYGSPLPEWMGSML